MPDVINTPKTIDASFDYMVIFANTEAEAIAEFERKYPWMSGTKPLYQLRKDFYFPMDWKRKP